MTEQSQSTNHNAIPFNFYIADTGVALVYGVPSRDKTEFMQEVTNDRPNTTP
jgi:hypothetical protein